MDTLNAHFMDQLQQLQAALVAATAALAALCAAPQAAAVQPMPHMPAQERRLMVLLADQRELTYKEIAAIMNVSLATLRTYRDRICDRVGVRSKAGLTHLAISWGLRGA